MQPAHTDLTGNVIRLHDTVAVCVPIFHRQHNLVVGRVTGFLGSQGVEVTYIVGQRTHTVIREARQTVVLFVAGGPSA